MAPVAMNDPAFETMMQDEVAFRPSTERFVLVGLCGAASAIEYPLEQAITLGRGTDCDICLADARVSRQHARLSLVPDPSAPSRSVVLIEDLGSRNGLRVDGAPVGKAVLTGGEKIQLGDSILRLDRRDDLDATLSARLRAEASTDPLTGLRNRRALQEALDACETARLSQQRPYVVLVADLDFFKKVNDTYGHSAGDAVLRHAAQTLQASLRSADTVFRFGGEEFVAILAGTNADQARQAAERIRRAIEGTHASHEGHSIAVTASIGVADGGPRAFEAADRAVYVAKESGRNCVRVATAA